MESSTLSTSAASAQRQVDINWEDPQLDGYVQVTLTSRQTQAWWWSHGFAVRPQDNESQLYWCCRYCNKASLEQLAQKKDKHVFDITKGRSSPTRHLKTHDWITETTSSAGTVSKVSSATSLQRHENFDFEVFKSLLLRWIVHDNIAFRQVESEHFRTLIIYLESHLSGNIPTRQTVKRWIMMEYQNCVEVIKAILANAESKIHISFDLWTSRSLLSLNGIVAHFLDKSLMPRTILLALPEQKGEHAGSNIADTVRIQCGEPFETLCPYDANS